eukprot:GILJ01001689.1.p1 GENE.GILJ01001689.1~~GILJ01001689.1.p1  ORF type:complete len:358 (+),score=28.29 GILJ01001689.1:58-1131(+)
MGGSITRCMWREAPHEIEKIPAKNDRRTTIQQEQSRAKRRRRNHHYIDSCFVQRAIVIANDELSRSLLDQAMGSSSGTSPRKLRLSETPTTESDLGFSPYSSAQSLDDGDEYEDNVEEEVIVVAVKPKRIYSPVFDISDSLFDYALALEQGSDDFKQKTNTPEFRLWLQKGSQLSASDYLVKCQFVIHDVPPFVIHKVLNDVATRKTWDKNLLDYHIVDTHPANPHCQVYYMACRSPIPFSDRDFVEKRRATQTRDGTTITISIATEHPNCPKFKNFVRGHTVLSAMITRPVIDVDGKIVTSVTNIAQVNVQGNIPSSLTSTTLPKTYRNWFESLRKTAGKLKHEIMENPSNAQFVM